MTLLSITVLTLDAKDVPVLGSIRSGMMRALSPVESAAHSVTHPIHNAWNGMNHYDDLERQNEALRKEIDRLKGQQLSNADAQAQVEKLQQQLQVQQQTQVQTVVAQIATGNFSSFDDFTARIDKGSSSGIQVGMPVVTYGGLIGNISRVTSDQSVVHLITDPDFHVGIRLQSNALGVGRGSGSDGPFIIDQGVGLNVEVHKGDIVTTSGLESAKFPPGLNIGKVSKITRVQSDQSQILEVALSADLSRLDYVQVLKWTPQP
jgi:rod shape-determining protein MreC